MIIRDGDSMKIKAKVDSIKISSDVKGEGLEVTANLIGADGTYSIRNGWVTIRVGPGYPYTWCSPRVGTEIVVSVDRKSDTNQDGMVLTEINC